jgi:predicted phosphodiesterase
MRNHTQASELRVAVLADIHGNPIALAAVLQDIQAQGGVGAYWVLGDLAAIGHDPLGALDRVARLPQASVVRGNTDRYLVTSERPSPTVAECQANADLWPTRVEVASSFSWTQGMVTASGWLDWLAGLPLEARTVLPDGTRVLSVHASPGSDDGQGLDPTLSREALRALAARAEADLVFLGHTHWPMEVQVAGVHLVNPGSVSNAFPPDLRASYLLLDVDAHGYRIQHRRVAYDRQAVVEAVQRVNHPDAGFIIRLMCGEIRPHWRSP